MSYSIPTVSSGTVKPQIDGITLVPLETELPPDYQLLGLDGYCRYQFYKPLAEHICSIVHPTNIFEIGFFLGSSSYCWLSSSTARVVSCDIIHDAATDCLKVIRNSQNIATHFNNRFTFIPKSSQFIYDDIKHIQFDLAFVDGRHDYQGVLEDLNLCYRLNIRYLYLDDFNGDVSKVWAQHFRDRYKPVHGIRFANGDKTSMVDGLLVRHHAF